MPHFSSPLVSCICISHNNLDLVRRSIRCFQGQTYPFRELIVAFISENKSIPIFLEGLRDPRIKPLEIPASPKLTLGEKRNFAIERSKGFYFCVWDDDDWYHPGRIEFQLKSLVGTKYRSSVLSSLILYDIENNESYLSATRWAWEQTLLCEKSVFENPALRYADRERGEDSVLLYNLKKNDLLFTAFNPALYIYIYHGNNTWHRKHWEENLIRWATKFSTDQSLIIQKILEGQASGQTALEELEKFFK